MYKRYIMWNNYKIVTLAVVGVMYGLTFVSYLSESKVLDELVSEN